MLENIPHWLGAALSGLRAGHDKLTLSRLDLTGAATLHLSSPAFAPSGRLPPRFTADGEGISPPLVWGELPPGTDSLALIVEDPDAPAPRPLVHAIVVDIAPALGSLAEGAIRPDGDGADGADGADGKDVGTNSYFAQGWLPPDPPTGHGSHDYVFQLLALSAGDSADPSPGRGDFLELVEGRILGAGVLIGTYSREEEAPVGPVGEGVAVGLT